MIAFLFSCVLLQAAAKPKEVKLSDGRVLINPVVLEQEPDGLSIGHQNGVVFVKFSDLPEKVQKKYNYNPKAAAKYKEQKRVAQKKGAIQDHQQKIEKQKRRVELKLSRLGTDIDKLRLRIKYINEEIIRGKKKQSSNENTRNQLVIKNANRSRVYISDRYYWRGGYHVSIENRPTLRERRNAKKTAQKKWKKNRKKQLDILMN